MLVLAGKARAENPFLTAFDRQKLVEAVPAERVRLKRKSNNKATFKDSVRIKVILHQSYIGAHPAARIDGSGNLIGLLPLTQTRSNGDSRKEILSYPFSQYLRYDIDYRQYIKTGRESKIAWRALAGIGFPYGNSLSLPYVAHALPPAPDRRRGMLAIALDHARTRVGIPRDAQPVAPEPDALARDHRGVLVGGAEVELRRHVEVALGIGGVGEAQRGGAGIDLLDVDLRRLGWNVVGLLVALAARGQRECASRHRSVRRRDRYAVLRRV